MDKYIGKRLDGRYEIQELIGSGGMAQVYKAYDSIEDKIVAIKILRDEFLNNKEFLRRFQNESKAIATLNHPNIVKVFCVSFGDKIQYIVMEYIDGITLKDYMKAQGALSQKETIHFISQILRAIQHAHDNKIIHRDLKPQNIMLLRDGTIKVTDFGIARFSDSQTLTMTDKAIGSVHYIAPEQAKGELTDNRTDVYSIGVMLYEMITGKLPFEADNAVSVAIMQLQNEPELPRNIVPTIPIGLQEITLKAMRKRPDERYPSAAAMLDDIMAFRANNNIIFGYTYADAPTSDVPEEPTRVIEAVNNYRGPVPVVPITEEQRRVEQQKAVNMQDRFSEIIDDEEDKYAQSYNDSVPQKKSRVGLIVGICAGGAAVIAGVIILLVLLLGGGGVRDITLPNFVDKNIADVENECKNNSDLKDLQLKISYTDQTDKDEGIVVSQDPGGDKKVKSNTEVKLVVSKGKSSAEVPNVANQSRENAIRELESKGFKVDIEEQNSDSVAKDKVIKTDPEGGRIAKIGSTITVYISKGKETAPVPYCAGQSLDEAQSAISEAGFEVGEIRYEHSDSVTEGYVIGTSPSAGEQAPKGSSIDIIISSGPESREVSVTVNIPKYDGNIDLSAQLQDGGSVNDTVSGNTGSYNLDFTGEGTKELKVYLNGSLYATYRINFNDGTVTQTASYEFVKPDNDESSSTPDKPYVNSTVSDGDYGDVTG